MIENIRNAIEDNAIVFYQDEVKALLAEIERLQKEKQSIALDYLADQGQWFEESDRLKDEIERLKMKCDKQAMILRRLTPENFPNTLFISSVLGKRDENNMPEKIMVVPAYGVDFSYIYEYNGKTVGMEW